MRFARSWITPHRRQPRPKFPATIGAAREPEGAERSVAGRVQSAEVTPGEVAAHVVRIVGSYGAVAVRSNQKEPFMRIGVARVPLGVDKGSGPLGALNAADPVGADQIIRESWHTCVTEGEQSEVRTTEEVEQAQAGA